MRSLIVLALLLAPAMAAAKPAPSVAAQLIDLEKQSWVAWQGHDGKFFDRFLSADHVEVGSGGPTSKADVVAGVASAACTVASYSVDHFKVVQLDDRTAVVTYRAAQDTKCGGYAVPSPVWATSVYLKRGGRWTNAVYVHSVIPPKAG